MVTETMIDFHLRIEDVGLGGAADCGSGGSQLNEIFAPWLNPAVFFKLLI